MKWTPQGVGWHTADIGGVVRETNGWCFWPRVGPDVFGPWKTLTEAKREAENIYMKGKS